MARISVKNKRRFTGRSVVFSAAFLLAVSAAEAQMPDTEKMNAAMMRYKNENAVFTNYTERLDIKYEDGQLVATTTVKTERLLTGDYSPVNDQYDYVGSSYFDQLTALDAVAWIPQKGGNYKRQDKHYNYRAGGSSDVITDASTYVTSFTGLTKGTVIRMMATREHNDISTLPLIEMQHHYPAMHEVFEVSAPSWVHMKFNIHGENTGIIKQTTEERNGNTIYRFVADNVPAEKNFSHVPSGLYYIPHIIPAVASMRMPGQAKDSVLLMDADHLYKKMFEYVGYMNVKQDTMLKNLVDRLTKGDVTDRQKAQHLYEWVQGNVHYIGFELGLGGRVPREADTVCRKMYGDCKDMSSLLMQMGRMAGLKTYFAWIGTTERPYTFEETPSTYDANHMICALKLGNDWLFMDGTHSNLPFGANRDDIQGKQALVAIDRDNYKIVTIPVEDADRNVTTDSTYIRISDINDNDLKGHLKMKMTGYPAWNLGAALQSYTKEKDEREKIVKKLAARGSDKFILDDYKLKVKDTGDKSIVITGNFTIGNYVHHLKKDVIVNMNVLRSFEDDYIDTTDRRIAWYHDHKSVTREVVVMKIPKGYKITYLPKGTTGKLDDLWSYTTSYKTNGKTITLTKEYRMNTMAVAPKYFAANNKAITALENHYKESVVLTAK